MRQVPLAKRGLIKIGVKVVSYRAMSHPNGRGRRSTKSVHRLQADYRGRRQNPLRLVIERCGDSQQRRQRLQHRQPRPRHGHGSQRVRDHQRVLQNSLLRWRSVNRRDLGQDQHGPSARSGVARRTLVAKVPHGNGRPQPSWPLRATIRLTHLLVRQAHQRRELPRVCRAFLVPTLMSEDVVVLDTFLARQERCPPPLELPAPNKTQGTSKSRR
jgi:hypothetical protein